MMMKVRFHLDPDGLPHIYSHGVSEAEVIEALQNRLEELPGRADSIVVIGRTRAGLVLRVIYAPSRDGEGIFVITAYTLPPKQLRALMRRLKRRHRR